MLVANRVTGVGSTGLALFWDVTAALPPASLYLALLNGELS